MEYHKIKYLTDRFWDGNCSDTEEAILKNYFKSENYLKEFQDTADYFRYTEQEWVKLSLNDDFDEKILQRIQTKGSGPGPGFILKIAAGIALIFSLYLAYQTITNQVPDNVVVEDSFDTPEQAYNEVKKALFLVSGKMNEGTAYGNELKKFSHAKKSIRYEKEIKQ